MATKRAHDGRQGGIAALAVLVATLLFAGCWDRAGPDLEVSLSERPIPEATPASGGVVDSTALPLRFVYASVLSPERSTLTYARLASYLSARMGRQVEVVRRRTYAELNELLRTGAADAGLVCTGAFALGEEDGLEAVAVPVINGKRTYRALVIVRRDSGLSSFDDLRGESFAFTDPLSNTGYRYVADRLRRRGTDAQSYFGSVMFTYSHDNSIEAVRDGIVMGGTIDSLVWDELVRRDPELRHDIAVIEESEDFPINPVAASPHMDPDLRRQFVDVFLRMHEEPGGRRVLAELGTDRFVPPTEAELEGYRAIARSWELLGPAPVAPGVGGK